MSFKFNSITITPNPVTANQPFLIAVDVVYVLLAHRWSDIKTIPWSEVKQKTWDELSVYSNIPRGKYSGMIISGEIHNL